MKQFAIWTAVTLILAGCQSDPQGQPAATQITTGPTRAAYAEFNRSIAGFFRSLDAVKKTLPSVDSAKGTVKVVNQLASAVENLNAASERFLANCPEVNSETRPPPEFTAAFARVKRMGTDYGDLPGEIGKLIIRFGDVPEVQAAAARFTKSITLLQNGTAHAQ